LREATRIASIHLQGVGRGEPVKAVRDICLHIRKSLSDIEVLSLSLEWLAIPARDEFSEDGKIETAL